MKKLRALLPAAVVTAALVAVPQAASAESPYVSFGDSYASGDFLGNYYDDYCKRSFLNYPTKLATARQITSWDYSCTSALTGRNPAWNGRPYLDTEIDWAANDSRLGPATSVVTVTIGGNDKWNNKAFSLYDALSKCADTSSGVNGACATSTGAPADASYPAVGDFTAAAYSGKVLDALKRIRGLAPNAKIVVVGYPAAVPATSATACLGYTAGELKYVNGLFAAASSAMSTFVTTYKSQIGGKVGYANIAGISSGHDLCVPTASARWVSQANFHPTEAGTTAIAGEANSTINALG